MPILNLLTYPRHEWPARVWDAMHDPAGADRGKLFDAMEAGALLLKKRGHPGVAVLNHMKLSDHQNRSGEIWRGFTAGYVLMLTLARAETGGEYTNRRGALDSVQRALEKRVDWGKGGGLSELKASWQAFRPVAHFWGAQSMCSMFELCDDPPLFLEWLAGAEDLRRRGEALRPSKGKTLVLDPGTTWRMPDELALPPPTLVLPSVDTIISRIESGG